MASTCVSRPRWGRAHLGAWLPLLHTGPQAGPGSSERLLRPGHSGPLAGAHHGPFCPQQAGQSKAYLIIQTKEI